MNRSDLPIGDSTAPVFISGWTAEQVSRIADEGAVWIVHAGDGTAVPLTVDDAAELLAAHGYANAAALVRTKRRAYVRLDLGTVVVGELRQAMPMSTGGAA